MNENFCSTCKYRTFRKGRTTELCTHPTFFEMDYVKGTPKRPTCVDVRGFKSRCIWYKQSETSKALGKSAEIDEELI